MGSVSPRAGPESDASAARRATSPREQGRAAREEGEPRREEEDEAEVRRVGVHCQLAACAGSPPNRRSRVAKLSSAARRSAARKSGHITGVKNSSA